MDPASFNHDDEDTAPQLLRNCWRACDIRNRLKGDATHVFFGNSTIIVFDGAPGTEITRGMSPSSSTLAWIGRARTCQVWNSVRDTRGVFVPIGMRGRARERRNLTWVPIGLKSTFVRSGSESVLTGQRHTPQVA